MERRLLHGPGSRAASRAGLVYFPMKGIGCSLVFTGLGVNPFASRGVYFQVNLLRIRFAERERNFLLRKRSNPGEAEGSSPLVWKDPRLPLRRRKFSSLPFSQAGGGGPRGSWRAWRASVASPVSPFRKDSAAPGDNATVRKARLGNFASPPSLAPAGVFALLLFQQNCSGDFAALNFGQPSPGRGLSPRRHASA